MIWAFVVQNQIEFYLTLMSSSAVDICVKQTSQKRFRWTNSDIIKEFVDKWGEVWFMSHQLTFTLTAFIITDVPIKLTLIWLSDLCKIQISCIFINITLTAHDFKPSCAAWKWASSHTLLMMIIQTETSPAVSACTSVSHIWTLRVIQDKFMLSVYFLCFQIILSLWEGTNGKVP